MLHTAGENLHIDSAGRVAIRKKSPEWSGAELRLLSGEGDINGDKAEFKIER